MVWSLQEKLPLPPTEILKTWADISTSTRLLGFDPQTDLKTGASLWQLAGKNLRPGDRVTGFAAVNQDSVSTKAKSICAALDQ